MILQLADSILQITEDLLCEQRSLSSRTPYIPVPFSSWGRIELFQNDKSVMQSNGSGEGKIVFGIWSSRTAIHTDQHLRKRVGSDFRGVPSEQKRTNGFEVAGKARIQFLWKWLTSCMISVYVNYFFAVESYQNGNLIQKQSNIKLFFFFNSYWFIQKNDRSSGVDSCFVFVSTKFHFLLPALLHVNSINIFHIAVLMLITIKKQGFHRKW